MLEKDLVTREDLIELREIFLKGFKEGKEELKNMSITQDNYLDVSKTTLYCLENIFGINNEVSRVDNLKAEKSTDSPSE